MKQQIVHVEVPCGATPEAVFAVLEDTVGWPSWSKASEARLEREGDTDKEGVGAIRVFKTGRITSKEEVVAYEPPTRFAYVMHKGLPLDNYRADVMIQRADSGSTITWHSRFEPKVPLTGWLNNKILTRFLRDTATRLARAAESR